MVAPSATWTVISSALTVADEPFKTSLAAALRTNLQHLYEVMGGLNFTLKKNHNHNGLNSKIFYPQGQSTYSTNTLAAGASRIPTAGWYCHTSNGTGLRAEFIHAAIARASGHTVFNIFNGTDARLRNVSGGVLTWYERKFT